jgi:transposase InsO family protein
VTNALGMAIDTRQPQAGTVIHSDQDTVFGSWAFTQRAKVIPIETTHWETKLAAIACYSSQLGLLWHDPAPWRAQLQDYAIEIGGGQLAERRWSV